MSDHIVLVDDLDRCLPQTAIGTLEAIRLFLFVPRAAFVIAADEGMIEYSEWSIPLGRRFRALKLWFLMRAHGLDGLRAMIRNHVAWAEALATRIAAEPDFEITSAPMLSLFSFRFAPAGADDLDALNQHLLERINDDGRIYLTQTRVDGHFVIRFQVGAFSTEEADVDFAFDVIREIADGLEAWG